MPATTNPKPAHAQLSPTHAQLLAELQAAFPHLTFKPSPRFSFQPPQTIKYSPSDPHFPLLILHELGHSTLAAPIYHTDIELIKIERAAWDAAAKFCTQFGVEYDSAFVESALDTYRDWLHEASKCPACGLTRYQDNLGTYHCPLCGDL